MSFLVTMAALLSALVLCAATAMPLHGSAAAFLLFASSFLGIERVYSAVADLLMIAARRQPPRTCSL